MKIHALTVSVNYADFLKIIIPRWKPFLESWTIVTDSKDEETAALAIANDLQLFRTDVFYEHGANFNKGCALETARRSLPSWDDWLLLVDADILPEEGWYEKVRTFEGLTRGKIFGARRYQCRDLTMPDNPGWQRINDALCEGYFQLFHTQDAHIAALNPVIEMDWSHAGVYDSHLKANWPDSDRVALPIRLTHLGEQENWHGRGNREAFLKMNHLRYTTGSYQQERIQRSGE